MFKLPWNFLLFAMVGKIGQTNLSIEENKSKTSAEKSKTADSSWVMQ